MILDEFDYVPYDSTGSQLLFDFLSANHENKCVILNTNLEFSRWADIRYDKQMTVALVGRYMTMTINNELIRKLVHRYFSDKMTGKLRTYPYDRYAEEPLEGDLTPEYFLSAVTSDIEK